MRIEIVTKENKFFKIPVPMTLLKMVSSDRVMDLILKNTCEEEKRNLQLVDFSMFRYNLDELKNYEGLVMVDIESRDGTIVRVVV